MSKNGAAIEEALAQLKNARYWRPDQAIETLKKASGEAVGRLIELSRDYQGDENGMIPLYALESLAECEDARKVETLKELAACPNELMRDAAVRILLRFGMADQVDANNNRLAKAAKAAEAVRLEAEKKDARESEPSNADRDAENMAAIYASMPLEQLARMNQMLQDKFFFFYQVFENLKKMSSVYDQARLNELLLQSTKQFIRNRFSVLFLAEEGVVDNLPFAACMNIEEERVKDLAIARTLLWRFRNDREIVNSDQLEMDKTLDEDLAPLKALECSLFLPMVNKDELIGLLIVGPKGTGEDYSGEDLELIKTFLDLGSMSVANAALYASQQKLIGSMFGQTLL